MTEQEYINVSDMRHAQYALKAVSEITSGNSVIDRDELNHVRKQLSRWIDTLLSGSNVDSHNSNENDLAICQMHTIQTVLSGGGMDLETAILELQLNSERFAKLAESENLHDLAKVIRKNIL